MDIQLLETALESVETDILAIIAFDNPDPALDALTGGWVSEIYASKEFTGKALEIAVLPRPGGLKAKRLALIGGGKREKFGSNETRKIAGTVVRAFKAKGCRTAALLVKGHIDAAAEGALLGGFEPDRLKTDKKDPQVIDTFTVVVNAATDEARAALDRGRIIGESQNFARDLITEPGNLLPPTALAARARQMASEAGLECEVLDRDRMKQLGMGLLLGVAQGSIEPPALIVVRYRPSQTASSNAHLALIGKGVTFDTGGISIKPSDGMEKMKYDMAGGAAVLGAIRALAALKPSIPVTAFVPAVENMPSATAIRPGDILTSLNGKTVEVLNTDAEGRLILADAIEYAKRQGCTHLVDAATLTGAIAIALGQVNVGAFTNDQTYLDRLLAASKAEDEKIWQMPLDDEYKEQLKSVFADLPNIGTRYGGAITAAWFLREFADPTPWIHLDIAGCAWSDDAKSFLAKGATGVAMRTFVRVALDWK